MYYDSLIKFLEPLFAELEITKNDDGTFSGKGKTIAINYNQKTSCYELAVSQDGEELKTVSTYLFDSTQKEKDIESVAIDFADTLKKAFGITKKRSLEAVELPTDVGGETVGIAGLTQKMLAFFPQQKDAYKEHCAENGRFLATAFYKENIIPSVKALFASGNKKQIKKFYDTITEIFIKGDNETVPFAVATISAALYDNAELKASACAYIKEGCPTFANNINNFCNKLKGSKKLKEALIK